MIYNEFASFLLPKIVREAVVDYKPVWKRLHCQVVDACAKDILFLLIQNKMPVPERLFRIWFRKDPYCQYCEVAVLVRGKSWLGVG